MALTRRHFLQLSAGVGAVSLLPRAAVAAVSADEPRVAPARGEWLAGDFHCHTTRSHDVGQGPRAFDPTDPRSLEDTLLWGWTAGEQIAIAEARGLDFLAVTDHNTVETLRDEGYRSSRLALVPGYEHSLWGGHAGVFVPSVDALPDIVRDTDGSRDFNTPEKLQRFLDIIHERDGVSVLNHPFYGNPNAGEAVAWKYPVEASLGFDGVEVWNAPWLARHDIVPFADFDNHLALPWWEREFLPRTRMPAIGGSDNHFRATTAMAGVGQPTTWVFAKDRSAAAILDGVRAGRTAVSAGPPALGGPRVLLTAAHAQGRTLTLGDVARAGVPLEVTAHVERAAGQRLRLISTGQQVVDVPVLTPSAAPTFTLTLPPGGWLRAEVYAEHTYAMSAVTSPIYAEGRSSGSAEPTTGTTARYERSPAATSRLLPVLPT